MISTKIDYVHFSRDTENTGGIVRFATRKSFSTVAIHYVDVHLDFMVMFRRIRWKP